MKKIIWILLLGLGLSFNAFTQTVDFLFGAAFGEEATTVDVPVYVSNFNEISGMQFTLKWDSMQLHFMEVVDIEIDGIEGSSFFFLEEGVLTVSAAFTENTTVADGTKIFAIRFLLAAACETSTTLNITGEPTPAFAFNFDMDTNMSTYYGLNSTSENIVTYCPLEAEATVMNTDCSENGEVDVTISGGIPPYSFVWNNGETGEDLINIGSGNYQVIITDSINNELTINDLIIEELNTIELDLGNDTTLCNQADYLITLDGSGDIETIDWFLDSTNLDISGSFEYLALESGTYMVIATSAVGCTAIDVVNITVNEPIELETNSVMDTICWGDSIQLIATGAAAYQWITGVESLSDENIANPIAFPTVPTNYVVVGTNSCQSDTAAILLDIHRIQSFAGNDTCIVNKQSITLSAFGGVSYQWDENEFLTNNLDTANPVSKPTSSTIFTVNIIDKNGCLYQDSLFVEVVDNPLDLIVPVNIITPNNDGKNDVLKFGGLRKFNNYKLTVFNRWGHVVFNQINYQNDWNGTFKNKPLPAGTYYYTLGIGDTTIKSALTILRD